jgi:LmbE family N-acetylglucosaminyl deacetylase
MNNDPIAAQRVLVIAAHPDDELLGCGGSLARHALAGDDVRALILCEGESLRYGAGQAGQASATQRAAQVLGLQESRCLGFPDQRLETFPLTEIIRPIEEMVRAFQPRLVYLQYGYDVNYDHQLLFKAALVATRPTEEGIRDVLAYDTASSTEWAYPRVFVPDTWIDISATLDLKLQAMACYESELRDYPHPRSLEALAHRARAWGNQCCMDAAEAFMTVRRVLRQVP